MARRLSDETKKKRKMGRKDRVLLWGVNNCIWINRAYALLSKNAKGLIHK